MSKFKIITFHSYKGGAGRSSTALNTLPYLVKELDANKNSPILLLDMDLDSAGMTYLLNKEKHFQDCNYDIKDFLVGEEKWSVEPTAKLEDHPLYKKFVPVGEELGVENEAVVLLGVNDDTTLDNNQMTSTKDEIFNKLSQFCRKNNIKAVVIDSSTGDQFSAILSIKAAKLVVHCIRVTKQFRIGSFNYLKRLKKLNTDKKIILLPTVVPTTDREIDNISQRKIVVEDILKRIKVFELDNVINDFIDLDQLGINEVERFKWKEGVLYKIEKEMELIDDEKEASKRYLKLAQLIKAVDNE